MTIPIRNLYYLLCYAWDHLDEAQVLDVRPDDFTNVVNLLARVLSSGLEHLLKRGLDRGYQEHREIYAGVRGKLDFGQSLKGFHLPVGRAVCVFEEMTPDVVHNRILKRTIQNLLRSDQLDPTLADELSLCLGRMGEVSDIRLSPAAFGSVQLHSNNGFYRFLLHVCRLLHDLSGADRQSGHVRFRDFVRDEKAMAAVYERFLLHFYRREQKVFRVWSESMKWADTSGDPESLAMLPGMQTDISMSSASRRIVMDAKYYLHATTQSFGRDTVRSGHLYQLFTYIRNVQLRSDLERSVEGILIYPQVDRPLDLRYVIHGHPVRIVTIDLTGEWRQIHEQLLSVVQERAVTSPASEA